MCYRLFLRSCTSCSSCTSCTSCPSRTPYLSCTSCQVLSRIELVNSIVALLSIDFHALETDVRYLQLHMHLHLQLHMHQCD